MTIAEDHRVRRWKTHEPFADCADANFRTQSAQRIAHALLADGADGCGRNGDPAVREKPFESNGQTDADGADTNFRTQSALRGGA